jgi:simple sugar transport system substrate-binding protein/basic membrane protein A
MTSNGPNTVLVNLIWNLEPLFAKMLEDTKSGKFDNPWYRYGIAEDAMQLKYNEALKSKIPPEALKAAEQAMADIKSGKVKVQFVPEAKK